MASFSSGMFYLVLCIVIGYYASTLNRNGFAWVIISFFLTPFLTSLILLILGDPKLTKTKETK